MSFIQELKNYTKDLSVLYVEDSISLSKQVSMFLKKFFKDVYTAFDGIQGLESYKVYKQNIVLTDLTMPNMDGYEMVKNLKKIDPSVKIIIISAHSDTENLLEALHIGVSDFIPKPIDNQLFQNALYKLASEIVLKDKKLDSKLFNNDDSLINKLKVLASNNSSIELINHYKGVPIVHRGYIIESDDKTITLHAPYIQTLAINYEKGTTIESTMLDSSIIAKLLDIDPHNREIRLSNFVESKSSAKNRKQIRVEVDDEFAIMIHNKARKVEASVKDLSINSISVLINNKDVDLKESDSVDLKFAFILYNESNLGKIKIDERIITHGTIFKIKYNNNHLEVVILFDLNKADNGLLQKYISKREIELIEEFKNLKNQYKI